MIPILKPVDFGFALALGFFISSIVILPSLLLSSLFITPSVFLWFSIDMTELISSWVIFPLLSSSKKSNTWLTSSFILLRLQVCSQHFTWGCIFIVSLLSTRPVMLYISLPRTDDPSSELIITATMFDDNGPVHTSRRRRELAL